MDTLIKKVIDLPDDASSSKIEKTAALLRGMNYTPTLMMDVPDFLDFTKRKLILEIERFRTLPESENHLKHIELMIYHYKLLQRLRNDDPKAWDIVNELFEDD